MNNILQGLVISLFGILITFAALGLMILLMVFLREFFKSSPPEGELELGSLEDRTSKKPVQEDLRKKAAGIAVAVVALKSKKQPRYGLGERLETPKGGWWRGSRSKE